MKVTQIQNDADYDSVVESICSPKESSDAEKALADKAEATKAIVDAVRQRGDEALVEFTAEFDGTDLTPEQFEVTPEEIDAGFNEVDRALIDSLRKAHANIESYHSKNLRQSWEETLEDDSTIGQRITPIESAGVYVPGGKAFYPSSVLMNIVPAKVAGVKEIIMVSPPSYNGTIHPVVLAAAKIAGADRVFRIGGAQAIAALAYGTETVPQVLKITGPGNTFVTVAKGLVRSICDIDTEAGPSEVTVIADATAGLRLIAGEMMAQAEHDEEASSILITTDANHIASVPKAIQKELETLSRVDIIQTSLDNNGRIIVARDLEEAAALSNIIGPEHLAIYTEKPRAVLDNITAAASIMLGNNTTVVWGDYIAGPNHILPTGRRARFASPLTAEDFRKVSSVIQFSDERVQNLSPDVIRMATAEQLTAHARAIQMRQKDAQ
ncbi:MAG: histidinol dehydrogenase [Candidatus Hydrogenedentota bacterium]